MDTTEIISTIKKFIPIHNHFIGVFPKDQLPQVNKKSYSLIINTDASHQPGQHWVALNITDKKGSYFDSYGLPVVEPQILLYIANKCPKGCFISSKQIQGVNSVNCGVYCIIFICLIEKGLNFCEILNFFSSSTKINDFVINKYLEKFKNE